jgi:hypothetical protein
MTSTRLGRGRLTLGLGTTALLLGGICGGCNRTPPAQDSGKVTNTTVTPTPPGSSVPTLAQGCKRGAPPATQKELDACLEGLEFDSLELAGDEQRLMVKPPCPGTCRYGPLAKIEPEKHSHLLTEEDLKDGRIIARLFLKKGETRRYEKLGLLPGGMTYWWVQKIPGRPDSDAGRSIYITVGADKLETTKERPLHFEPYQRGQIKQALARWLWQPKDETTQGSCGGGSCR